MSFEAASPLALEEAHQSWLQNAFRQTDLLVLDDASKVTADGLHDFEVLAGKPIKLMIWVPIKGPDGKLLGALLVAHHLTQAGLSSAQKYVLQTHAVQLAHELYPTNGDGTLERTSGHLMERLRLLESVVVHAKDAILITEAEPLDTPGPRIVYCNAAFTATTGYSEAEVLGLTPRILHCDNTNRETLDQIRTALEGWQPVEVELLNKRRDGSEFWVQLSIVPVANERGWFTHWISVQRDISERKEAEKLAYQAHVILAEKNALEIRLVERQQIEKELSYAASHDALTQLNNRAFIMARLSQVFEQRYLNGQPHATVLFMDLDRFKLVNDSLGHRTGDLLLSAVARRLEQCLRPSEILSRFGGDEFVLLVEGELAAADAAALAMRIIDQLQAPLHVSGQDIFTACSIGIVSINKSHETPEELLRDADVAMYTAKSKGGGQYALFDHSMREKAIETLSLQSALKQAIARNEFVLHYQPIYDLQTGNLKAVEALIRWNNPQRGLVRPDLFIPFAEEIGAIQQIGYWVMSEACRQLQEWRNKYPEMDLQLNVNVSGRELKYSGFVAQLEHVLTSTHFPADRLQIEVTENIFLHEPEAIGLILEKVREMGVRVALDDFGTGYSSLAYIDRYPIDAIKIDRSFVSRMMTHNRTLAIVQSILWLGRKLGFDITAEGIETTEQLERLKELRCPSAQGYLLAYPMPPDQLAELLAAQR
ncbi:EAL domain-containing protein [Pseudomonas sp. AH2]|uniref:putative bifunctional diguanylate cyclase/phosphodiesterase n=2 Tax=unclassified Pseudomonas TaxID=196821 RepID=UPI002AC967B1|nr:MULTISPECIES: EAL domain-containing protein [unclassified Pseudomonas]WPX28440.1 EAL domain-containing protein [Pseudomonas sp. AH2]WPX54697.1 EAL domain-containing protein [Pseudomonas sp. CCI4.2]